MAISVEKLDTPCGRIQHTRKLIRRRDLHRNGAVAEVCAPKTSTRRPGAHLQNVDTATQLSACQYTTYVIPARFSMAHRELVRRLQLQSCALQNNGEL